MSKRIKRIQVCFNEENNQQMRLFRQCKKEFGVNMSGGIRDILWLYFFGNGFIDKNLKEENNSQQHDHDLNHPNFQDINSVL